VPRLAGHISFLAALIATTVPAWAGMSRLQREASDLTPQPVTVSTAANNTVSPARTIQPDSLNRLIGYPGLEYSQAGLLTVTPVVSVEELPGNARAKSGAVKELPPAPSSAALFLSGMLTIGAYHLARSARHIHLTALPDWYHANCPDQIGHATPFDLDIGSLPVCCFEQPAGQEQRLVHYPRPDLSVCRLTSQCVLTLTAPRGPPQLS
jgi:hypothetical protein